MRVGRIFSIKKNRSNTGFILTEECDRHFNLEVTQDELICIANKMIEMANNL